MAQQIELEFVGGGTLFESLKAAQDGVVELGNVHKKVQEDIQGELVASVADVEKFNVKVNASVKAVADLGKQAASGGVAQVTKGLSDASKEAARVGDNLDRAADEATRLGRTTDEVGKKSKVTADQYRQIAQRLREVGVAEDQVLQKAGALVAEAGSFEEAMRRVPDALEPTETSVESLRKQLFAAREEAGRLAAEFGIDSVEARKAQERVGQLANSVSDLNKRFQAFDPGKKFQALNQLTFALINGAQAVGSIASILGGDNQQLQQTIFYLQSAIFAFSGLQNFLGDIGSSLKTVRALLLGTSAAAAATGTATTAASGGFAVLTTSVRAFTATLITNPIFLAVAAIAALGLAIVAAGDDADDAAEKFDKLYDRLLRLRDFSDAATDLKKTLADLDVERDRLNIAEDNFEAQASLARRSAQVEAQSLTEKEKVRRANIASLQAELIALEEAGELSEEEYTERNSRILELEIEANKIRSEQILVAARLYNEMARIDKQAIESAKANARERKALQEEVLRAERELADKLRDAARANAGENDPFLRVEFERRAREEEINELEQGFKRKLAAIELQKQLGARAFRELSEEERNARTDDLIRQEDIQLPARQQEQINNLRLIAEAEYQRELSDLQLSAARARAEILSDTEANITLRFKLELEERIRSLRKAGVDELDIIEFTAREGERFRTDQAQKAIDLDTDLQTAIINARKRGAETEKEFERQKALDILAIKIAAAEASLKLIPETGTREQQLRRAELDAILADLTTQRQKLLNTPLDLNLLDLLGIAPDRQAEVKQALDFMARSAIDAFSSIIAARQAELQVAIQATDEIIADAQRRQSELQGILEEERRKQEEGNASNVASTLAAIEATKKAERDALAEKKRIQQEQAKLAKQQAGIDAAVQASSLITAGATLFKTEAFKGTVGIITAIATLAGMLASFLALKAKVRQATAQQFYRGTERVQRRSGEARGIDTVHAMLTEDEAVIPVQPARKHRGLVRALVKNDFRGLTMEDVRPLLLPLQLRLNDAPLRTMADNTRGAMIGTHGSKVDTGGLERRSDVLADEVRIFRRMVGNRETEEVIAGQRVRRVGRTVTRMRA